MTNRTRLVKPRCTIALAIALGLATLPAQTSFAATPFDGTWSVRLTAESGQCPAGYTVPIRVSNGRVSYSGPFNARANGKIGTNGALQVSFAHSRDVVNARGSIKGRVGQGSWKSPTKNCRGTWVARKA
jgi:hypothetical protein